MHNKILLIGGGGHCKSVLDSILSNDNYSEIGIVDKMEMVGKNVLGVQVVGCDRDLAALYKDGFNYAFITVGSIGSPIKRIELFNLVKKIGFIIPTIVDLTSNVSNFSEIEEGVYVGKMCTINTGTIIKKGSIINSGSIVEHDCKIGSFVHIAPGAVLGGDVTVGDNTHVGLGSVIKQHVNIGANSIIGMGSVVLKDVNERTLSYGNPCREVKML